MRTSLAFVPTITLLALAACGDDIGPPTPPSCLPDCPGSRAYDAQDYALRARFDWTARTLEAMEDVTLTLAAGASPVVELDAQVEIITVHAGAQALAHAVDETAHTLRVDLTPLDPGTAPVTFTVVYRAVASDSLIASGPRDDDPVTSRMLYTDSEPDRGLRWLVANHHPADRATFAATLVVGADEDVISNGDRLGDHTVGSQREVAYRLDQPIPTYLMAFAAGQIEHRDRTEGRVPLAVWYRKGLVLDPDATLDVVETAMTQFEELLGPYPWNSYAVVLVPQYGGGMENATITFNNELSSQGTVNVSLNAHELGHQWFGDWVTMADYEDVWVKEGMATLLAAEAQRAMRDREGIGRRFGGDFSFDPHDAVVDPTLTGLAKYTSGPYERAAWLLTQIRARVGEEVFWQTLRDVLDDHALGSIDGEAFLRAFEPALGNPLVEQLLASLTTHEVPAIALAVADGAGGRDVTFTMTDPSHQLIAPLAVTVVDAAGAATETALDAAPRTVTVPAGGYLALDEAEVHPYWTSSFTVDQDIYYGELAALLLPGTAAAREAFGHRSAAAQERATFEAWLPPVTPDELAPLVNALDTPLAAGQMVSEACGLLANLPPSPQADAWSAALSPLLASPARRTFSSRWGLCPAALAQSALANELTTTAALRTPAAMQKLEYLLSFEYGPDATFATLSALATSAPSLRVRDLAINRLSQQQTFWYKTRVPDESRPAWQGFFRDRLASITSPGRFRTVWRGVSFLQDAAALPQVAPLFHRVSLPPATVRDVVCRAHAIATAVDPSAWPAFQAAAQPWDQLAPEARAVLEDPARCL